MGVTDKLIMDRGKIPDVISSHPPANGLSSRRSSSSASIQLDDKSIKRTLKENTSMPTSFSCNHLSNGHLASNMIGIKTYDGGDGGISDPLMRARAGTADGSTQTHPLRGSRLNNNIRNNRLHASSSSVRTESSDNENSELDGGFWAWIVVLGAFLTNGIIFGVINCFGVIFKQIQENFSTDGDTSSFLTCKFNELFSFLSFCFDRRLVFVLLLCS